MQSIISCIITHKYKLPEWFESIVMNGLSPKLLYSIQSPRLAELIIKEEPFYPGMMSNPNPGLVNYIKEIRAKLTPQQTLDYDYWVRLNPNPEIKKFVGATTVNSISDSESDDEFVYPFTDPSDIFKSDNPKYFNYIKNNPNINYEKLMMNPSEEMAEFILSNVVRFKLRHICSNPNPGLTKYFYKLEAQLDYTGLSSNTNSALAPLMIRNIEKLRIDDLINNSNDSIVDYLLENKHKYDFSRCHNENPKMAEIIIKFASDMAITNPNPGLTEYNLKTIKPDDSNAIYNCNPKLFHLLIHVDPDGTCIADFNPKLWHYMTGGYSDRYLAETNDRSLLPVIRDRVLTSHTMWKYHSNLAKNPIIATIDKDRTNTILDSLV